MFHFREPPDQLNSYQLVQEIFCTMKLVTIKYTKNTE